MNMSPECRAVSRILSGRPATDGAGVRMTRVIATPELDHFDPFLLLDEFRSDDPDDYIAGFPDHPHRGFETVTYMLAGAMEHRDNQGNAGLLGPGSVQWMTAGCGIVHSEMPRQEDGLMWGFQLWVNLPAETKMTAPRYQDIPAERVPEIRIAPGITARLIAGSLGRTSGPVSGIATDPLYLDVCLQAGSSARFDVPLTHNAFIYVYDGEVGAGKAPANRIDKGKIALFERRGGDCIRVTATRDARLLLVAGRPLDEPVARWGPFVMNSEAELRQAVNDYQSGRF
jgi:redox-sensitive bicupin YhaK (pirin superfamily)